jgi:membrane associated rhomboid family serine protease
MPARRLVRWPRALAVLAVLAAFPFLVVLVRAQDPLYSHRRSGRNLRNLRNLRSVVFVSSSSSSGQAQPQQEAPWRNSSAPPGQPRQPPRRDYNSHVVDFDTARRDPRTRSWKVNLKTRQRGRLSLTTRIIMTNIVMYVLQVWRPSLTQAGLKRSDLILQGRELYRLVTPVFLHATPMHLMTNMFSLSRLGPDVEGLFGSGRYLATYLAAGVAGNLLSAYASPNPGLGASGAVFGMVGSYLLFLTRHDWLLGRMGEDMSSRLIQTVVLNVGMGLMNPMIDNWAHLGGALGGAAMAYYIGPRLYMTHVPEAGQAVVDIPLFRLPRNIESIPARVGVTSTRMLRRLRIQGYQADLPATPWRPAGQQHKRQRRDAPNRSIKPKHVPD